MASSQLHRPTPYSISVAALIALHCQENSPLYETNKEDFIRVDAFLQGILLHKSHWSNLTDVPVQQLLTQLEHSTGIAHDFETWLQIAASSVDALVDLLSSTKSAIQDGSVDVTSANGVYIRQCVHAFDELSFESVVQLYQDFQHQLSDDTAVPTWTLSPAQMDAAIRQQCGDTGTLGLLGANVEEMQEQLETMLQHNPELPAAHFLKFLLCLRSGERVGAMDALHLYLDHTMITNSADILQFAAVLKAALHDAFGETELAQVATQEAVKVAQQSQDTACVAFALGWLSVYNDTTTDNTGSTTKVDLLARCAARAGTTVRPLVTGSNLLLAAQTNSWLASTAAVSDPNNVMSVYDRPTHLDAAATNRGNVNAARQKLVASGLWNHYGIATLSEQSCVTALQCPELSGADRAVAINNASRFALTGQSSDCVYGTALRTLVTLRDEHGLATDGIFIFDVALILGEWAVRRGDYEHAEALITCMEGHLHPRIDNYKAVVVDVAAQKALLLSRQGCFDEAKAILKDLVCKCKGDADQTARLLLHLSICHLDTNKRHFTSALPPILECLTMTKKENMDAVHAAALSVLAQVHLRMNNCPRAISFLQAALPTILQQEHVWLQAEAYLTLGKCYMKRAKDATADTSTRRIQIRMPTADLKRRNKILRTAVKQLERAKDLFERCQDIVRLREIYYLLARIFNEIGPGCQALRDAAAHQFANLSTPPTPTTTVMSALSSREQILTLAARPAPVS